MEPQIGYLAVSLLLAGCVAGFSAGLFGIGGGAVMVPVLYFVFSSLGYPESVVMHCAVATSSAVIIISSIRSVSSHHGHGAVDWNILWPKNPLKSWGVWVAVGALLAAGLLARHISGAQLTLIFGFMMCFVALQFIFGRPDWRLKDDLPGGVGPPLVGGGIGAISALMGIGGGAISASLMVLCGKTIHRAIGTASGIGMFIAVPATVGYIYSGWGLEGRPIVSLGYVNLLGFILIAMTSLIFIPLGARTAHRTDQRRLKMIFGIFLIIVSLNMIRKAVL